MVSNLTVLGARALAAIGRTDAALGYVDRVLAQTPGHADALFHKARIAMRIGDSQAAKDSLRALIEIAPDYPLALNTFAGLLFPGPRYRDVLQSIHRVLAPRTYLEIGVEYGLTLKLAAASETVVGVDPNPRPRHRLPPNTRVFAETSDDFFSKHDARELFQGKVVDFAFIDGMHKFEFVLRDFINVERWCGPDSTVVLHDCLPVAPVSASRERVTQFWVGDTWKALECLLRHRPDLRVAVIPCYPSGLVIVRGLDPGSTVLHERLAELESRHMDEPYPCPAGAWPSHYPVVENSEASLQRVLGGRTLGASA